MDYYSYTFVGLMKRVAHLLI